MGLIGYFGISKYRLLKLLSDLGLFVLSYALAFLLRFDFSPQADITELMILSLPIILIFRASSFWFYGLFQGEWRYSSIDDLFSIFKAVSFSTVMIIPSIYAVPSFQKFPFSIFIIDAFLLILLSGGVRFFRRVVREVFPYRWKNGERTLIVGNQDIVSSLVREMRVSGDNGYNVVALVDDNPEKHGTRIHGIEVMGDRRSIPHIVATKKIDQVIIAQQNGTNRELWELIEYCQLANVKFKILTAPSKDRTGYRRKYLEQIRDIQLEDLIGRKPVACDLRKIQKHIQGRRVLITGAGGSIGSELSRQVAGFNPGELVLFDRSENSLFYIGIELSRVFPALRFRQVIADVMNRSQTEKILCQYQPDLIFHAAAHKHVPMMELNPAEAIKNNVFGTRNMVQAAMQNRVSEFIFISTDKAVRPISFMGVSKRIAEQYVQGLAGLNHTKFSTVRFGNVIGSTGSVIRLFKEQLERGGPITVTHPKVTRYFMSISEAVQLILQATLYGKGGEIFILDMGEPVNIYSMAKAIISLAGKKAEEDVKIVFTGLRPGDKLYEELYDEEEVWSPTPHEKIMAVNGNGNHNFTELSRSLDELEKSVDDMDRYALAEKLRVIEPSFHPMPFSAVNHTDVMMETLELDDKTTG